VLVLLPPSMSKRTPPDGGGPFDAAALSFASLGPTRAAVLEGVLEVSAEPDAARRLGVSSGLDDDIRANLELQDLPAAPAGDLYAGALYDALGYDELDAGARRRARTWVVAVSALWGAVRLGDRIPTYRLHMCARLPGLGHLPQVWQGPLESVLPAAAGRGLVVDGRAAEYATAWRPTGEIATRTIVLKVRRADGSGRGASSNDSKRTRGLVARCIVTGGIDPDKPEDLASSLATDLDVELMPPVRAGRPWQLDVVVPPR
jgi:uncharacterized protein